MKMEIKGTGSSLPENIISNDDIAKLVETNDEWIRERTGIGTRHISTGQTVAELASDACKKALSDASVNAEDVDLIILATCSPEVMIPCVACQVQDAVGATNSVAFDLNAACGGFLFALNTVYAYLKSGVYKNALVVGAEVLSKLVDWEDRGTCILFGDGAGAVYVEAEESDKDNYSFIQKANGSKGNVLTCGTRDIVNPYCNNETVAKNIWMDGREIYKFAVSTIPACITQLLDREEVKADEIDHYILHQANLRIITSIAKKLGQDMESFPTNVERVGNMSSASIPVLLDECNKKGILKRGDKVILSGFGAGLTYGASLLEW